jgi:hypothetical protein
VKLVAAFSTVLPPLAQTVLYATSPALEHADNYEVLVEPSAWSCERYQVLGGKVMAKVKEGRVPVVLFNPNTHPVKIYRCSTLGHLTHNPVATILTLSEDNETPQEVITEQTENKDKLDRSKLTDPPNVDLSDSNLTDEQRTRMADFLQKW